MMKQTLNHYIPLFLLSYNMYEEKFFVITPNHDINLLSFIFTSKTNLPKADGLGGEALLTIDFYNIGTNGERSSLISRLSNWSYDPCGVDFIECKPIELPIFDNNISAGNIIVMSTYLTNGVLGDLSDILLSMEFENK